MATALKRTEKGADEAETDERAERLREGLEQLTRAREDFVARAKRFGKGAALWEQRGWGWEEPDWAEEPADWPPIARLLWLYTRLSELESEISMLVHFMEHPRWCPECHPDEKKPPHYNASVCANHFAHAEVIKALATRLGFRQEEG